MNALETNRHTEAWRAFGESVPVPRGILMISAHWYTKGSCLTVMAQPRTIHDFGGFPDALFAVRYPAPGDPALAAEVAELVKPRHVALDDNWGLDHGTWSVLRHAFPDANIPVVQLSIDAQQGFDFHVELGARLAPLRERGVLIMASGNIVHNLGAINWQQPESAFDWAHRFDDAARVLLTEQPGDAASLASHPDYLLASPTPDHLVPALYIAGLAAAQGEKLRVLTDGYAYGALSMTSYAL
jgi:4,5-DOPA dioxygenase extradiol